MPNHHKPIEECELWDVLDWETVARLSVGATGDPREDRGRNAVHWSAKLLIEASDDAEAWKCFHDIIVTYIRSGTAAGRRQEAGELATFFGADPVRLTAYIKFKRGSL